ncbi:RNA polymerase principal sigma factor HrdA [Posidoniimonas polymericola]|uniref:RNA polymerase principal sigma factor HrdA n=2 Tax=Posidoniimonas polymericola TaxID=2528002 RepID=A0A5C5YMR5_9BACT|nr:RNA polymerase principal sigma factor HrdA [Posidoniimonas polymericola]
MATATATRTPNRRSRAARVQRGEQLLSSGFTYIGCEAIASADLQPAEAIRQAERLLDGDQDRVGKMCEEEILTPQHERDLFHSLNLLKRLAAEIAEGVNRSNPKSAELDEIESLSKAALQVRDYIIRSNLRLVYAVVKKTLGSNSTLGFDEFVSDGVCTLMNAVEKFDYSRGFRFSTYAYRSVARTVYRAMLAAQKEESRLARDAEDWAFEQQPEESPSLAHDVVGERLRSAAAAMVDKLDRREQLIIRSRYALGAHRKVRSFQDIANRLGISKERVRQLEKRASDKLHEMASQLDHDELFGAALA